MAWHTELILLRSRQCAECGYVDKQAQGGRHGFAVADDDDPPAWVAAENASETVVGTVKVGAP